LSQCRHQSQPKRIDPAHRPAPTVLIHAHAIDVAEWVALNPAEVGVVHAETDVVQARFVVAVVAGEQEVVIVAAGCPRRPALVEDV